MSDTVFILGAGFSHASGIPLLGGFVDRMWEYSVRGKTATDSLSQEDLDILAFAMQIRKELDGYHGRAMFDDRNIEDILSLLSFNLLAGNKQDQEKLAAMARAITRTIELSCEVKYPRLDSGKAVLVGPNIYRKFWSALFAAKEKGKSIPAIITFNYDLVLERSLFQALIGTQFNTSKPLPFSRLRLLYHSPLLAGAQYQVRYRNYHSLSNRGQVICEESSFLVEESVDTLEAMQVDLLKLHGSLNFPRPSGNEPLVKVGNANLTEAVSDPYILPPVFNKLGSDAPIAIWRSALARLRSAKNIVVVGYSLPRTDIYMQYFLKAALGPNSDVNRIIVFDPVLFQNSDAEKAMRSRYEECFAPQLRGRIIFNPPMYKHVDFDGVAGSTDHFVGLLASAVDEVLF
jgi:hypothetical protein